MEYHVMNVMCFCSKFQNDLTVIYGDMGPFICAQLYVPLSVKQLFHASLAEY